MQKSLSPVQTEKPRAALAEVARAHRLAVALAHWLRASWPALVILALPVAILWPSLFGGRATTASDILLQSLPWSADHALGSGPPQNPLLFDEVQQISPWFLFTRHELLAGRLPLWNPSVAAGTPFLAAGQPGVFYPLTLLGVLLPYPLSMTVMTLLKWWLVGLGMYVFARSSLRLGRAAGLVAAISFMFSSFIAIWLIHPVGEAAMLLPWLMWSTERAIRRPSRRRVALLALFIGLVGLTGHPEMAFHVTLGSALYALWLVGSPRSLSWPERARMLGRWVGGAALGLCLAAIQYLPTAAALPHTLTTSARALGYGGINVPVQQITTWLVPNLWGNPALLHDYWGTRNYSEEVWYAGTVALALAVVGALALRKSARRREMIFFALLAVCFAALLYRLPPFIWLTSLPVLDRDSWTRLALLSIFGVSALAGFGFETMLRWGRRDPDPDAASAQARRGWSWPQGRKGLLALAGLLALLLLAIWAVGHFVLSLYMTGGQVQWITFWLSLAALLVWATALLLFLRWQGWLSGRVVGGALLALMLCDQLVFALPLVPQPSASLAYPDIPAIARLQQTVGSARMAASARVLTPDTTMPYGLNDLRAYESTASSRYLDFMATMDPGLALNNAFCCQYLFRPSAALMGVASVKYYVTPANYDPNAYKTLHPGQKFAAGPLTPLWTEGGITLWRNTLARPQFYFADQVIPSGGASQAMLALRKLRPGGRDAIIEGAPPAASAPASASGTISVISNLPGQITLRAQTNAARWLVVDEGYDAGWRADVDGASATIHPANEMFQAVFVPAGAHIIHLVYRPASFLAGALLSALALLTLLVLLLGAWAFRRPRFSEPQRAGG